MPRINLLPWRDEERKERKVKFLVALGGAAVGAALTAFVGYLMMDSMVNAQDMRNEKLKTEIAELDKQIEKINSLEADKARFIARMEVIEKLQRSRPEIVHIFDEIAKQLPDGVYLTHITQSGKRLKFEGVAQSSTRVSAFMRNIDGSSYLKNPSSKWSRRRKTTSSVPHSCCTRTRAAANPNPKPQRPPNPSVASRRWEADP